jgi:hypothetical protein
MERSLCGFLPFHDNDGSNFLAPEKKKELISLFLLKLVASFLFLFLLTAFLSLLVLV